MEYYFHILQLLVLVPLIFMTAASSSHLHNDYYRKTCPDVESIVQEAVRKEVEKTFDTAPSTLRLLSGDCFVQGCDASAMLVSRDDREEKAGYDMVIKAKAAVDKEPGCRNKVSCADILVMATRDVIALTGGPSYAVEMGRLDGRIPDKPGAKSHVPYPDSNLDQLNALFAPLTQTDMIALSGAHTIGFSHCSPFSKRIYNFDKKNKIDPSMNAEYARKLQALCPKNVDARVIAPLDTTTPQCFDNVYYKNLQKGKGLLYSDQVLFQDKRSREVVDLFASNKTAFEDAFVGAITRLGRLGVKTGNQGEIRRDCTLVN